MQVSITIIDFNIGASRNHGLEFARTEKSTMNEVIGVNGNRIEYSCKIGSGVVYGSAWICDEKLANKVAAVMQRSKGRPMPQIWAMDLALD